MVPLAQEAAQTGTDWTTVVVAGLGFVATATAAIVPAIMARRDRNRDRRTIQKKQLREDAAKPLGDAMGILNAASYYMGLRGEDVNLFDLRAIADTREAEADQTRPLLRHLAGLWPEVAEEINTVESYLGQLPNHLRFLGDFSRIEPDAFEDEESMRRALGMIESWEEDYQEAIDALSRLYDRLPTRRIEGVEE